MKNVEFKAPDEFLLKVFRYFLIFLLIIILIALGYAKGIEVLKLFGI